MQSALRLLIAPAVTFVVLLGLVELTHHLPRALAAPLATALLVGLAVVCAIFPRRTSD